MNAVVVYESHWGNTAAVAQAIAEGLGGDSRALNTDEADARTVGEAELLVVGAPVIAFGLPRESAREQIAGDTKGPHSPDVSHPSLRTWLDALPTASGWLAAFETRLWWSPRGATGSIEARLRRTGRSRIAHAQRFVVSGGYGPLREGELDRARAWGRQLAEELTRVH